MSAFLGTEREVAPKVIDGLPLPKFPPAETPPLDWRTTLAAWPAEDKPTRAGEDGVTHEAQMAFYRDYARTATTSDGGVSVSPRIAQVTQGEGRDNREIIVNVNLNGYSGEDVTKKVEQGVRDGFRAIGVA